MTQRNFLVTLNAAKLISADAETVTTAYELGPERFVRSLVHSSPGASVMLGCWEKAARSSGSGSSPPSLAQDEAAAAGVSALVFGPVCQHAPAKSRVPCLQPAW